MIEPPDGYIGDLLIVDDTPDNLRLLSSFLTEHNYKVRSVISGQMALTAATSSPPDLILLDINMPEMNGFEVAKRLKANEKTQKIPIIFISALNEPLDKVNAFSVGGVDYITKPFQFEEVLARVNTHLNLRKLQTQLQNSNVELEKRVAARTAELEKLNAAYARFVPREFLSYLHKESIVDLELGDQVQQELTIMFSDIRSFTNLSESMSPQENFNFINSYLSRISPLIHKHDGFIDKFIGDGIMALFPGYADDALEAAIEMQRELLTYNNHRKNSGYQPIRIGTGVHTGPSMLGIIGEENRMQGTVISDAVNLTSRLERLTKLYGVSFIISEQTLDCLRDPSNFDYRFLDKVKVKGKQEPVLIFEVFNGDEDAVRELKLQTKSDFKLGLQLYHDQKFAESSRKFSQVVETNPKDKAAALYIERTDQFMISGVPQDWGGVTALTEK